jgi:chromosome segregation ATPase
LRVTAAREPLIVTLARDRSAEGERSRQMASQEEDAKGLVERISEVSEGALGELTQSLLDSEVFSQALTTALGAGERAVAAQRSALSALNLPSAADLERLERRLRSLSERLESLEDRLDQVATEVSKSRTPRPVQGDTYPAQGTLPVSEPD